MLYQIEETKLWAVQDSNLLPQSRQDCALPGELTALYV